MTAHKNRNASNSRKESNKRAANHGLGNTFGSPIGWSKEDIKEQPTSRNLSATATRVL